MSVSEIRITRSGVGWLAIRRERVGTSWEVVLIDSLGRERSRSIHLSTAAAIEAMAEAAARYVGEVA